MKLRLGEKRVLRNWIKLQSLIMPVRYNEKQNRELKIIIKHLEKNEKKRIVLKSLWVISYFVIAYFKLKK
jgi:hypothetical protein